MKYTHNTRPLNTSKEWREGIPEILASIHLEKATEIIPVKIQFSLKNYLQQHKLPVSTFARNAIIEKLERDALKETGGSP